MVNPSRYLDVLHSSNGRERVAPVAVAWWNSYALSPAFCAVALSQSICVERRAVPFHQFGDDSIQELVLKTHHARDRSRTLHRSGSRRSRIGRSVHMERRAITFCHFLWILTGIVTVNLSRATCFSCFMGLGRNRYCKPVARDLFFMFYGSWQELIL